VTIIENIFDFMRHSFDYMCHRINDKSYDFLYKHKKQQRRATMNCNLGFNLSAQKMQETTETWCQKNLSKIIAQIEIEIESSAKIGENSVRIVWAEHPANSIYCPEFAKEKIIKLLETNGFVAQKAITMIGEAELDALVISW
jgi:hypothetical protein